MLFIALFWHKLEIVRHLVDNSDKSFIDLIFILRQPFGPVGDQLEELELLVRVVAITEP